MIFEKNNFQIGGILNGLMLMVLMMKKKKNKKLSLTTNDSTKTNEIINI
jgi:hypothetical protein